MPKTLTRVSIYGNFPDVCCNPCSPQVEQDKKMEYKLRGDCCFDNGDGMSSMGYKGRVEVELTPEEIEQIEAVCHQALARAGSEAAKEAAPAKGEEKSK